MALVDKLTIEKLREVLDYDPETGAFRWKVWRCSQRKAGDVAGSKHPDGYRQIKINCVSYLSHRLAIFWVEGEMPLMVDHINGVRDDNRIVNLRKTTKEGNQQNRRRAQVSSKSGLLGASFRTKKKKWVAQITTNGVTSNLGLYETAEQAHQAYLVAKRQRHATCSI